MPALLVLKISRWTPRPSWDNPQQQQMDLPGYQTKDIPAPLSNFLFYWKELLHYPRRAGVSPNRSNGSPTTSQHSSVTLYGWPVLDGFRRDNAESAPCQPHLPWPPTTFYHCYWLPSTEEVYMFCFPDGTNLNILAKLPNILDIVGHHPLHCRKEV